MLLNFAHAGLGEKNLLLRQTGWGFPDACPQLQMF